MVLRQDKMSDIEAGSKERPFGPNEEKVIVSLAFMSPEFFGSVGQHLEENYFYLPEARFVFTLINSYYEKHETIPTKEVIRDIALKTLTVDDDYESVLKVIDYEPDPREIPMAKDSLLDWARNKAYGRLYDEEAISAFESGNYDTITEIIENAQRIVNVSDAGMDLLKTYRDVFEPNTEVKLTTGFRDLDRHINEGGPTKKDVFVWMAPTGVGKSLVLVNTGIMCYRRNLKVLHVTMELSEFKTKQRYVSAFTKTATRGLIENKERVVTIMDREISSHSGGIIIYEFPPEEISVDTIYQIIKWLKKTKAWFPDVVIVDYLELMFSRRPQYNKEDYIRQKRVSTELRGLATKENVLLFTATQTNRDVTKKGEGGPIDVNRVAESYGKMMPSDYVVSLNQTPEEYNSGRLRFYIAKNRNGPKFKTISAKVDYETMVVEIDRYRITE